MKINPVTIFIVVCFAYPLLKGFLFKFSSYDVKRDWEGVVNSIAFIAAIFIGVRYSKLLLIGNINKIYKFLPTNVYSFIEKKPMVLYFVVIPILVYLIYIIIRTAFNFINKITFYRLFDGIDRMISNKNSFVKRILGAVVQVPRSICYLITILFVLNILSMVNINKNLDKYLQASKVYGYLCKQIVLPVTSSNLAKKLPSIIDNSFKVVYKQKDKIIVPSDNASGNSIDTGRTIVYYNGVTLDEGVASNSQIDNFARNLVFNETGTENKARKIYDWIGNNISYDYNKANLVLNNDYDVKSGAIYTFNTRKGICFDYSCLYVAMARANNIKVRLITGQGFNGVSWVSHAWNQVYIPESGKWINVDTTFAKGGNYFNKTMFSIDHKDAKIVGEW
ncbi:MULTISPECIES: transglutaminase-like domain-containing protein [Clostridium]|uniref:transglutaminase-like domain-containing protein n=1 Tax=Clostridium TaxID=1485 RepID=UPI00069E7CFD|nr:MULTISPECIES: transglutaminase-like domain-containing protein [Clostridium]KOF57564.1 transglutaminase [Clostridium sp. DMHC 10]MCD2345437.1 transglutaminase-like domain-containing protein [Clostridium guangxiense]